MTPDKTPTNDEIMTLWHAIPPQGDQTGRKFALAFGRAVLAKWGSPVVAGEPQPSTEGPPELWLQLHCDCLPHERLEPVDYTGGDVTWCWHAIHSDDVRYVRADLVTTPQPTQAQAGAVARYRLLIRGQDTIQADDEFLREDGVTWRKDPSGIFVGCMYEGTILLPARRAIDVDHGIPHKEGGQHG